MYLKNLIKSLEEKPTVYDTSRIFTSGCSMGAAFTGYSSQCLKSWYPTSINAFAMHSTGIKFKGDGNNVYGWGEDEGA